MHGQTEPAESLAAAIRGLRCVKCQGCATHIDFVDPAAVDDPLRAVGDVPIPNYPEGGEAVAQPGCDAHVFGGYSMDLMWALSDWVGWLQHLAGKGIGAKAALLALARAQERQR